MEAECCCRALLEEPEHPSGSQSVYFHVLLFLWRLLHKCINKIHKICV